MTKKIILASRSKQRKNILKLLGIPFTVKSSKVKEISKIQTSVSALVKKNALLKARDIASKEKSGLVIGADTVVYGQGKLILKPKNLKEARRILKRLFSRSHYVYTGIAVIDVQTKKEITAVEKTKVDMTPLSDKEIRAYHRRVPPMDKAGGFDIEGLGSVFIHRIEGDYTNVIGLPLAKLYQILKKFGVTILMCLMMVGCTSEYNLATKEKEYYMHSTSREVDIGRKLHRKIIEKYDVFEGVEENDQVRKILDDLTPHLDRDDVIYEITILDKEHINAFAIPGGFVYLFKGILDHAKNEDELASVIAHELAHITTRHGVKRLQASYGATLLQIAAMEAGGNVAYGVSAGLTSLFMEHSKQDEFEADELGVKYMQAAGYDPLASISFMETMKREYDKEGPKEFSYWRTHPHIPERMANASRSIKGELEFRDYIRLIDQDEFNPERGW